MLLKVTKSVSQIFHMSGIDFSSIKNNFIFDQSSFEKTILALSKKILNFYLNQ